MTDPLPQGNELPKEYNAQQSAQTESALEKLRRFGLLEYNPDRRMAVFTADGILSLFAYMNEMKETIEKLSSRVNDMDQRLAAAEKEKRSSIPVKHLERNAVRHLEQDPTKEEMSQYRRTEDIISTWSAAHDDCCQDTVDRMETKYQEVKELQERKAQQEWLERHQGNSLQFGNSHEMNGGQTFNL